MSKITINQFSVVVKKEELSVPGAKVPQTIRPLKKAHIKPLNERILLVTPEVAEERLNICKQCESFEDWGCKITANFMPKTTRQKNMQCPKGYWSSKWD